VGGACATIAPRNGLAIPVKLGHMDTCRYCGKLRDEWDCHGPTCRRAIAQALSRQRKGLPMVANPIRNEIPADATTGQIITVLSRQRMRARRGNEERRERKALENTDGE
jgi:hypothetical protein